MANCDYTEGGRERGREKGWKKRHNNDDNDYSGGSYCIHPLQVYIYRQVCVCMLEYVCTCTIVIL